MTREVEARLKLSAVDRTAKAFGAIEKRLNAVEQKTRAVNRVQAAVERSTHGMLSASARVLAPAAIGLAAKNAITTFADVERRIGRIGITAGASAEETSAALELVQKFSKEFALPLDDVMEALDTTVASGKDLKEAFDFLPSVLAAAQASGSATSDIANTALKASSALQIEAKDMTRAFDIMVAGGKAGQFELKDMAAHIPSLANSFATLGYKGEGGLKQLVAILQTIREDTGSAENAATQAGEVFGKMLSSDTINKFEKFGIDLPKQMKAAKDSGEDMIQAFVRISKIALKGDLEKLPQLFTDKEFRGAMTSLITSPDALQRYIDILNGSEVDGTVWRDTQRVINDTQASIQRLSSSWDTMITKAGASLAPVVAPVMEGISKELDYQAAMQKALKDQGYSALGAQLWFGSQEDADKLAIKGGYNDPEFVKKHMQGPQQAEYFGPDMAEFPGGGRDFTTKKLPGSDAPIPGVRPTGTENIPNYDGFDLAVEQAREEERVYQLQEAERQSAFNPGTGNVLSGALEKIGAESGKQIEEGSQAGAEHISGAADDIRSALREGAAAISSAVGDIAGKIRAAGNVAGVGASLPRPNGDPGRSMPSSRNDGVNGRGM